MSLQFSLDRDESLLVSFSLWGALVLTPETKQSFESVPPISRMMH